MDIPPSRERGDHEVVKVFAPDRMTGGSDKRGFAPRLGDPVRCHDPIGIEDLATYYAVDEAGFPVREQPTVATQTPLEFRSPRFRIGLVSPNAGTALVGK